MLDRNSVFLISSEWKKAPFTGLCRFLATDGIDMAALIAIRDDATKSAAKRRTIKGPVTVMLSEFLHHIELGHITSAQYAPLNLTIDGVSEARKKGLQRNRELIASLNLNDEMLFEQAVLTKKLKDAEKIISISARNIRRILYNYYVGGQTELALVPGFEKRGGPGRRQKKGTARRGRKPVSPYLKSDVALPDIREKLHDGVVKHYLPGKKKFRAAYVDMLKESFSHKHADTSNEKLETILISEKKRPTIEQFRYMIREVEKEKGKRLAIPGRMRPLPEKRESLGLAIHGVQGPGHRFEIDATKLQIQLVSRYGRTELVGTPSLYIVIDVWSSAIVGYSLSLENFSWTMAASALANAFSDKQKVFDKLGIDYTHEDWPCKHLPSKLMADRAELISDKSGGIPNIGIHVEIAAAMCPEMKGTVESKFNEIKHQRTYRIPGAFPKDRKRREKDGKNDAALNIDELENILVKTILAINRQPLPPGRIPPEYIEDGGIDISRIGLYAWGIKNRVGFTRTMNDEEIKYHLMTPGTGSVTSSGIRFEKQNFRPLIPMSQFFEENNKKPQIRYDEHDARQIYVYSRLTNTWEPAYNDNPHIQRRGAVAFYEFKSFCHVTENLTENIHNQNAHKAALENKETAKAVRSAESQAKQEKALVKPRKSRRAIRENQANERIIGRQLAAEPSEPSINTEQENPKKDAVCRIQPKSSIIATLVDAWGDDE